MPLPTRKFHFSGWSGGLLFLARVHHKYSLADKVIISEESSWQEFLDSQTVLQQFTRYAFADRASFDTEALEKWQSRLPANYYLSPIDKESYERLAEEV